jgi:hypothetical protein
MEQGPIKLQVIMPHQVFALKWKVCQPNGFRGMFRNFELARLRGYLGKQSPRFLSTSERIIGMSCYDSASSNLLLASDLCYARNQTSGYSGLA